LAIVEAFPAAAAPDMVTPMFLECSHQADPALNGTGLPEADQHFMSASFLKYGWGHGVLLTKNATLIPIFFGPPKPVAETLPGFVYDSPILLSERAEAVPPVQGVPFSVDDEDNVALVPESLSVAVDGNVYVSLGWSVQGNLKLYVARLNTSTSTGEVAVSRASHVLEVAFANVRNSTRV
jgi:hypothetical protein